MDGLKTATATLVLLMLAAATATPSPIYSGAAIHWAADRLMVHRLNTTGYRYLVLYIDAVLEHIGSYEYVMIYLSTRGIYAYGYAVIKDPDKPPTLYLVAGSQNSWYTLRTLDQNTSLQLALLIDTANGTVETWNNTGTARIEKNTTINITGLTIALGSIPGDTEPRIKIRRLIVAATNNNITSNYTNHTIPWNKTTILYNETNIENKNLPPQENNEKTPRNQTQTPKPPEAAAYISAILMTTALIAALAAIAAKRREKTRETPPPIPPNQ